MTAADIAMGRTRFANNMSEVRTKPRSVRRRPAGLFVGVIWPAPFGRSVGVGELKTGGRGAAKRARPTGTQHTKPVARPALWQAASFSLLSGLEWTCAMHL